MKTNLLSKIAACVFLCAFIGLSALAQMASEPNPMPNTPKSSAYKAANEKKFYVKVYGFYALLTPGAFSGQRPPGVVGDASGNTVYATSGYASQNRFGAGLRLGGGVGYVVNDFINLGVDGEYMTGELTESYLVTWYTRGAITNTTTVTSRYPHQIVNIIPNITFKAVSKPQFYIYNRVGLLISIPMQLDYFSSSYNTYPGRPSDFVDYLDEFEFEKKIALGYQAALGIQFRLSDSLRGFAEIVASSVQLKSDSYVINASSVRTKLNNQESEQARRLGEVTGLDFSMPVSSVGLSAGLAFRF